MTGWVSSACSPAGRASRATGTLHEPLASTMSCLASTLSCLVILSCFCAHLGGLHVPLAVGRGRHALPLPPAQREAAGQGAQHDGDDECQPEGQHQARPPGEVGPACAREQHKSVRCSSTNVKPQHNSQVAQCPNQVPGASSSIGCSWTLGRAGRGVQLGCCRRWFIASQWS